MYTATIPQSTRHTVIGINDRSSKRSRILDFARIAFAALVLLSHTAEQIDGNRSREILTRYTKSGLSFGEFGVDAFFILSGFLILRSWNYDPRLGDYLQKRILRIVPGYLVAAALSILVIGSLAPATPHFFSLLLHKPWNIKLAVTTFTLDAPWAPPVLPGLKYQTVNASMWTLPYEFRCYLVVAFFGVIGLLRSRSIWLITTAALTLAYLFKNVIPEHFGYHLFWVLGEPQIIVRLGLAFFVGGCFFLYQKHIVFIPWLAGVAIILVILAFTLALIPEIALIVCGAYLLFYLGQLQLPDRKWIAKFPDISYGMYLYGWPVQSLVIWYFHLQILPTFLISLVVSALFGFLSWHFVERPCLKLKRRPSATLPA